MNVHLRYLLVVLALWATVGCIPQKEVVYFQGQIPALTQPDAYALRIYPGDILSINIFTTHAEAYPYLAAPSDRPTSDTRSAYERGYIVRDSGMVNLPLVGNVQLTGMTIQEASHAIEARFRTYFDDPIVTIKKLSFKITVIGEVNKPGLYTVMNERVTLPEALGMAGDLTQFADRTNLRVIRSENRSNQEFPVDITRSDNLTAETYYLHPDDIVYVAPTRKRAFQNVSPTVLVFTSILTTAAVLITALVTVTR